ncbi:MAG: hypothetical protein RIC56_00780 [Pseudomonadales bacterium]
MTAVISHARVTAGHGGAAELVVTLRHGNGGLSDVTLDAPAAAALFDACAANHSDELIGHGWEKVQRALTVSWNRFANRSTEESTHV